MYTLCASLILLVSCSIALVFDIKPKDIQNTPKVVKNYLEETFGTNTTTETFTETVEHQKNKTMAASHR